QFNVSDRCAISGHSMGGHGALIMALDKLHNLDAVLFESELRNFHESYEGGEGSGRLQVRQQAADLNNKSSAPQSEEVNYSAALENSLCW
ncbi:hypothetical protein GFK32_03145, partial [Salmonella enterica subsp. enterica serovar Enteritidis]|nr:hypothetical protein [Salmonella enterica subsp. enterica serovar Enteritidis]